MAELKKFFKLILLGIISFLIVSSPILYYHLFIDPSKVFFSKNLITHFEPNKQYIKMKYILKNKEKYDSFIFGASRTNFLIPEKFENGNYFNMNYSGGIPAQHFENIKYLLKKGVTIKNLVIGIDYVSFFTDPNLEGYFDMPFRRNFPVTIKQRIEFYSSYLFFIPHWKDIKAEFKGRKKDQRGILIDGTIELTHMPKIKSEILVNQSRFRIPFDTYGTDSLKIDYINYIDSIKKISEIYHINTIFFINPVHYSTFTSTNLDRYYGALKKLAETTDFYDFGGINPVTIDNRYYNETSHYLFNCGDKMIEVMNGNLSDTLINDFGVYVNKKTINRHIATQKKNLKTFLNALTHIPKTEYDELISKRTRYKEPSLTLLKEINGNNNLQDTVKIFTPVIILRGTIGNIQPGWNKNKCIKVRIGKYLYDVKIDPNDEEKNGFYWMSMIPVSSFEKVHSDIEIVILKNGNEYAVIDYPVILERIFNPDPFQGERFACIDTVKNTPIYNINESNQLSELVIENKDFINISGTFSDNLKVYEPSNMLIKMNQQQYVTHFKSSFRKVRSDDSWSITLPISSFNQGVNSLQFCALSVKNAEKILIEEELDLFVLNPDNQIKLESMKFLGQNTPCIIDKINNENIRGRDTIHLNQENLSISGWAIDLPGKEPLSKVLIQINGINYESYYGVPRVGVVKQYRNEAYLNSGWRFTMPARLLNSKFNTMKVIMITRDGNRYYKSKNQLTIINNGLDVNKGINPTQLNALSEKKTGKNLSEIELERSVSNSDHQINLERMKSLEQNTPYFIDRINDEKIKGKDTIHINNENLNISGWAIDLPGQEPLSKVLIQINGINYESFYGIPRMGVMKQYGKKVFLNSGWRFTMPARILKNKCNTMNIIMVTRDGKKYYRGKKQLILINERL